VVDRRDRPWPVKDQGSRGTCVAFAGTASHEALRAADGELSEEFLYWGSKQRDGLPADVDGTTLEAMGAALSDLGQSTADQWPYDDQTDDRAAGYGPTPEALMDAEPRRLEDGGSIDTEPEQLIASIDRGILPVIGLVLFRTWHETTSDGRIGLPDPGAVPLGGHAVALVGYRSVGVATEFIVRNSWGQDWGDDGYGYLPAEYVEQYGVSAWRLELPGSTSNG
jgi:hypothetical protein